MKMHNLTTSDITIRGVRYTILLPASLVQGADGEAVDLTSDFDLRQVLGDCSVEIGALVEAGSIRFDLTPPA